MLLRFKPAVSKRILIFSAGAVWICIGAMLISFAAVWLNEGHPLHLYIILGCGIFAGLMIHHFGFLKIVDKNLKRIMPMDEKRCLFGFMSWKSYIMVAVMMGMGVALRHSPIPKPYLAVLYIGIGFALVLSGFRYIRIFVRPPK